ncbi:hypothetical protein Tco_1082267 [Tanacetum coccineum]|uniref:Uncharacterized protein n=1 Tax=Tanacetum coccineum TaxID=301880 RepID=A0ABQ5I013_9ASTR
MTTKRTQVSPIGSPSSDSISDTSFKDQERLLPIANVGRIMKKNPYQPIPKYPKKQKKLSKNACPSSLASSRVKLRINVKERNERRSMYAKTSESLSDNDVCETSSSTPQRVVSSQGFDDLYRERVVGYGDELVNMVKLESRAKGSFLSMYDEVWSPPDTLGDTITINIPKTKPLHVRTSGPEAMTMEQCLLRSMVGSHPEIGENLNNEEQGDVVTPLGEVTGPSRLVQEAPSLADLE